MIYLDNAATSWPKPDTVSSAVVEALNLGGNPGRSTSGKARTAADNMDAARTALAELFNISDPKRIIFTLNATDALNLAICGTLKSGDHVITSQMEHNAVARPLAYMEDHGVRISKVNTDPVKGVDPDELEAAICDDTSLVVMTHASNVTGTLNPIEDIGWICRSKNIPFLVDASQTAGSIPVDTEKMNIDMLAFPGHKSLLGPTGTGGLFISENADPAPLRSGGTGVFSHLRLQPDELPYRYEAGTQNTCGIAGLLAGARTVMEESVNTIFHRELDHVRHIIEGLQKINAVTVYGPASGPRASAVSFNIGDTDCAEVEMILETSYGISVRSGLQCAPDTHRLLGTFERGGTVRVSPGFYTTEEEIDSFLEAVAEISSEA